MYNAVNLFLFRHHARDYFRVFIFEVLFDSVKSIQLDTTLGRVEISWPMGANGVVYISINKFHEGQMVYQQEQWNGYMNRNTILNGDDITVIAEIIENAVE